MKKVEEVLELLRLKLKVEEMLKKVEAEEVEVVEGCRSC